MKKIIFLPAILLVNGCFDSESYTTTPLNSAPIIETITPITVLVDSTITNTINASDLDGDPLTYTLVNQPSWASLSGNQLTLTPNRSNAGQHQFQITVSDGSLTATSPISVQVALPMTPIDPDAVNHAPVIEPIASITAVAERSLTSTINASDLDGDPLTYALVNQPSWASLSGNQLTLTPNRSNAGQHQFQISVSDGSLTATSPISVQVALPMTPVDPDAVNHAPVIEPVAPITASAHSPTHTEIRASDADGDALTYQLIDHPEWVTLEGSTLVATPSWEHEGQHTFAISVSDGSLSDQTPITLDVIATRHRVSTSVNGEGAISPTEREVVEGLNATFTLTPNASHQLVSVQGCGGVLNGLEYHVTNVITDCQIEAQFEHNAKVALQTGDHNQASLEELTHYGQTLFNHIGVSHQALLEQLYHGISVPLTWDPTHDSAYARNLRPSQTFAALNSTNNGAGEPSKEGLVFAGSEGNQKYAYLGANLFVHNRTGPLDQFGKNLLGWLSNKPLNDVKAQLSIVTAHLSSASDSYWFQHNEQLKIWLDENLSGQYHTHPARECDGTALLGCLQTQQPDILILSHRDSGTTYAEIEPAITYAKQQGIAVMLVNYSRGEYSELLAPLIDDMGLVIHNNYWSKHKIANFDTQAPYIFPTELSNASQLLVRLATGEFEPSSLEPCNLNFLLCTEAPFVEVFKAGADWYRTSAIYADGLGVDPFADDAFSPLKIGLLIADKFRQQIDYPIHFDEQQEWQQALFADWVVSYTRANNQAQPDLGEYIIDKALVTKGNMAHYAYPELTSERQQVSVPYSGQWTSTGWYALPGQKVTITRHDNSDSQAYVKLHYARDKTNRVFENNIYRAPIELTTERLKIPAQGSVTFSTPYGAPIYIKISNGDMQVDISATGIAKHPAVLDFGDPAQLTNFERILNETEIPHVDLKNAGAEQHLRRDRFMGALGEAYPTVADLLRGIKTDHIGNLYTLAGYKLPGQSLVETLPSDVSSICTGLFGDDCVDDTLHVRTNIQHANYDQNAQCGFGCAGNPWDSGTNITPTGWLDNHELGHNLQTHRLNVAFAEERNKNQWHKYEGRATENSVNIFPYYVLWKSHYIRDGKTTTIKDSHMNHKDVFNVVMSDILNLTDSSGSRVLFDRSCTVYPDGISRFVAPWQSNAYAVHNSYRMGFYIQLLLQIEQFEIAGKPLDMGYHIYTLMYLHDRIFGKYAKTEALWNEHRTKLGFSLFDYTNAGVYGEGKNITSMPGNDFMLVALSFYTQKDWRPYFDMFGLHYTDLAAQQVTLHAGENAIQMGMYVLEEDLPPRELSKGVDWLPLNFSDTTTLWPRNGSSPADCLTH
ncbi:hypothetical protein HGP28_16725 [Vibrio sp. SM6]|uniref:Peptidase M60 domain-containing protein n=1 Tax=Vibrio agarilyticus TaxID=2726741 RepID=A0A7X8TTG9_9VIBR|nr:ImpA family metalloprotease [Vibrio agarilyticus]NLS14509.1 hypothetical protein [Vibrio agarilyticus]